MRLRLSMSFLGHLCMETSVGCLRKETCRAASPGLSSVLILKRLRWVGRDADSDVGNQCVYLRMHVGGCREAMCAVGKDHQLNLCNQILLDPGKPQQPLHLDSSLLPLTFPQLHLRWSIVSFLWHWQEQTAHEEYNSGWPTVFSALVS